MQRQATKNALSSIFKSLVLRRCTVTRRLDF